MNPEALTSHTNADCDRELRAFHGYNANRCEPLQWMCSCGKAWFHVCDEAEGCFYWRVGEHDAEVLR